MVFCVQWISQEEQDRLDRQVEEYRTDLKKKEQDVFSMNEKEIGKLKEEVDELRESRSKLRSHVSSVSSSVTIYPATVSPESEEAEPGAERGVESTLEERDAGGQGTETSSDDSAVESTKTEAPQEHTDQ